MAPIGIWHAILQIGVAVLLIKKALGSRCYFDLLIAIFWWIGRELMRRNQRVC